MSTPANQLPNELDALKDAFKSLVSKFIASSQTVQELMKANIDLRAALHLAATDKTQFEAIVSNLANPSANVAPVQPTASMETSPSEDAPVATDDAAPVSA